MKVFNRIEIEQRILNFLEKNPNGVVEILGPTASGKTGFSIRLAKLIEEKLKKSPPSPEKSAEKSFGRHGAEILSVDSRQVYRDIDISSAKVTLEEMDGIVHHGLDLRDPVEELNAYEFQQYAFQVIAEIENRGNVPIMCGGTMLWLDSISENYIFSEKGKKSAEKSDPKWPVLKIGIHWDREKLYERINLRSQLMFENGLIEETEKIRGKYPDMSRQVLTSFGYQEIMPYLDGEISYEEALIQNQKRNRNYAKRQLTWWRGREDVMWVDGESMNDSQ